MRYLNGLMNKGRIGGLHVEFDAVNGQPGGLVFVGDHLAGVVNLTLDESDRVESIFLIVNPEKLPNKTAATAN